METYPAAIENSTTRLLIPENFLLNDQNNTKTISTLNDVITPINDVISNFTNFGSSTNNSTFPVEFVSQKDNKTVTMDINFDSTDSFSIQEQVVIGAAATVGLLAIVAIVLRMIMPMFRKKKKEETPSLHNEDLYDAKSKDERYKLFVLLTIYINVYISLMTDIGLHHWQAVVL